MRAPHEVSRIDEFVTYWAHQTPQTPACILDDERITYRELRERIDRLARALIAHGVSKGDRVATLSPPNPDYLVCFLATSSIGAIWVGLNPRYRVEELRYVLEDSEPTILLTRTRVGDRSFKDDIGTLTADAPYLAKVVCLDEEQSSGGTMSLKDFEKAGESVPSATLARAREAAGGHDPCLIIYTSGSTGKPKGALLHHHGIARFSVKQNEIWPVSPLVTLNYFPINHAGCVTDISTPTLSAGGTIVFMEQFDPAGSLKLMEKERVTMWGSVPTTFQMQLELPDFDAYDLSAVQIVVWSGAAAPEALIRRLLEFSPNLANNYGMTETMVSTALTPTTDVDALCNSVGFAFPGVEIKLVASDGSEAPVGEPGEIWVRSEYNLAGYWRKPDATAEAITPDGFFKTGDLATLRPDGRYKIVGRIKEMYKSGGYNVYPREIEMALEEHPHVSMAAVVSIPDPVWQEVGVAYIVPRGDLSIPDLERYCRDRLANYKIPKRFVIEENLPLLPIGKVNKIALKALAADQS
ncbi:MAG: class I adenylate-forming enzyme family protein [Hyphomonas sp.]